MSNTWDSLIMANKSQNTLARYLDTQTLYCINGNEINTFKTGAYIINTKIAQVSDVQIIVDDKVIVVTFDDGTSEKAVLCDGDTFSLEQGISICLAKKLLSDKTGGHGSREYNKIIKRGMKVYSNKLKAEAEAKRKEEEEKSRRERIATKKDAKRKRREDAERERAIEIQKEAYLRAMQEFHAGDKTSG